MNDSEEFYEKSFADLRQLLLQRVKASGRYLYLDENKKSLLANLQKKAEQNGYGSVASQEREARNSEIFREHLLKLSIALEEKLKAQLEYELLIFEIECRRTIDANKRKEMESTAANTL